MLPLKNFARSFADMRFSLLAYMLFLAAIMFAPTGGEIQSGTLFSGVFNAGYDNIYRLQEWESEADRRINAFMKKEGISVQGTVWKLREKDGTKPVQWSETEYQLGWSSHNSAGSKDDLKKRLDDLVADLGIVLLTDDRIKLDGKTYIRLNYGITWDAEKLVTHRLVFKLPSSVSSAGVMGLGLRPKKSMVSPGLKLSQLRPVPKGKIPSGISTQKLTKPEKKPAEVVSRPPEFVNTKRPAPRGPRVAIIIDDLGFVKEPVEAYFRIQAPLTMAVLPGGPYSREQAIQSGQAGFQVLLHQPLEPTDRSHNNPGPGLIGVDDSEEFIRRQFQANLADVPGAVGFNNHMGSAGTRSRHLMRLLMTEAKMRGLFFVDSRSIASSVGDDMAREMGVPYAERQVFLDNSLGPDSIRQQLDELRRIALRYGSAIGIAHARPGVAQAIAEYLPIFAQAGIEIVHVSELLRHR